jgi:hypothetical protein
MAVASPCFPSHLPAVTSPTPHDRSRANLNRSRMAANFEKRFSREDFLRLALSLACALYRIKSAGMIAQMIATIGDYHEGFKQVGAIIASASPSPALGSL